VKFCASLGSFSAFFLSRYFLRWWFASFYYGFPVCIYFIPIFSAPTTRLISTNPQLKAALVKDRAAGVRYIQQS
jgi:hypothetical protein